MAYQRKTKDVFSIQEGYWSGEHWLTVASCYTREDAYYVLNQFKANTPGPYRIVVRRVHIC